MYLKTPILPMWLTKCNGQMGILFNPNKDLFRNKAAENKYELYNYRLCNLVILKPLYNPFLFNRFNLYYYASFQFGKKVTPTETILTMDSKKGAKPKTPEKGFENTEENEHALENCIHTKY